MPRQQTENTRVPMAKTNGLLKLSAATPMNSRVVENVTTNAGPTNTWGAELYC